MTIDPTQDETFMRMALAQAALAPALGEVPIAALLVHAGQVLALAHNLRETRQDPTAHAEILVIQEAAAKLGTWRLIDCALYVTLEPCPMCAGAIVQSRIARIVFAAWDPKAGACGSLMNIPTDPRLNHRATVTGGLCEIESQELLREFFRQRRRETP
ncbi:tRNA-specific adenosine deaminase [Nitrospira lenta]|uniref:tRNA-specific adenosine deaminase n=2 Tax=Nitrospira lenta TaxID=1436998 RepID=A0A330L997_9BACT|nr:tRNA-specific adenosine deaminase [Nitrospira lenta]